MLVPIRQIIAPYIPSEIQLTAISTGVAFAMTIEAIFKAAINILQSVVSLIELTSQRTQVISQTRIASYQKV